MNNHFFEQKDCGLQAFWSSTPQFKTARVSAHLVLPLTTPENAALYALVPNIISRATREYPDYTQFGKRLAELYGASVQPGVTRVGDNQILTLAAAGIANPYAFGGEDVQQALSEMLESILFTPLCDENGLFPEDGFLQEQRQLLETLDAEYNDKATYAMQRCVQTMFAGEPAGVPRIGTREAILNATREGVKAAWEYAVKHAQICQFTIGDGADDRFAPQDLSALRVAVALLGGTPTSRLFQNVREKQSLCYYCAARHDTPKNVMLVQSGVETKDLDRTEEAILKELNDMKKGNITDDEILFAKLAMCNSYNAVADSAASMETWYLSGMLQGKLHTPEEYAECIMNITKDEIVSAAERVTLDTVYKLKGAAK